MKYSILLILTVLILIAGCGEESQKAVSICGDNVCDVTESCACEDCKYAERCQESIIKKSQDCGDGKCTPGERCDLTTYETVCPEDCHYTCPAKTRVSEFSCGNTNCQKISKNHFKIIGATSSIKATLENTGEKSTDTITPHFTCYKDDLKIASKDGGSFRGVTFKDYFENYEETTTVASRVSTAGNKELYYLSFNIIDLEKPYEAQCTISLHEASIVNPLQTVYIEFN
jgi:hypothetical protein